MTVPYPTPSRLALFDAVAAGHVRHHHFVTPKTDWHAEGGLQVWKVTDRVAALAAAGLVRIPAPEHLGGWSLVEATDAGREWSQRARAGAR